MTMLSTRLPQCLVRRIVFHVGLVFCLAVVAPPFRIRIDAAPLTPITVTATVDGEDPAPTISATSTETDGTTTGSVSEIRMRNTHQTAAAAAAAAAERVAVTLASMEEEYDMYDCKATWAEFPSVEHYTTHNSTTRQLRPLFLDDPVGSSKQTMAAVCMCGLLHDAAQLIIEDEEEERLALTLSVESFAAGVTTTRATTNTITTATDCSNGFASKWPCNNIDLIYHLPFSAVNQATMGNDIWGWTHTSTEREFAVWCVNEGTYFVEITHAAATPPNAAAAPTVVGFLPHSGKSASKWHDVKVIDDFAYIGSEAKKHGMQIFDLTRLLNAAENTQFDSDVIYKGTGQSHNIVANPDTKYIYIVGSESGRKTCSGGLHIVNVSDPTNPIFAGCYSADGYTHDAQCVVYNGPDTQYVGHEICFCFNEKFIAIVDVTDKSNIIRISKTKYTNNQYTHQGWLSSDMTHIVWGDEVDEITNYDKTRTLILDITNLTDPTNFQQYFGKTAAIDHNLYIVNAQEGYGPAYMNSDLIYQSNYRAGLRILQVINIDTDYDNATNIHEVGYFDTFPADDKNKFNGAWSAFPYFDSGLVVISSFAEGLFVVKPNLTTALTVPSPSTSPSATPSPINPPVCENSKEIVYVSKKGKKKKCNWVKAGKKLKIRKKRCNSKKYAYLGKRIKENCPKACGEFAGKGICKNLFVPPFGKNKSK